MTAPRPTGSPRPTLLILIAAALTLLTLQYRGVEPLEAFQRGVRDIIEPLRSVTDRVVSPARSAWHGLLDYDELRAENERLAARIANLEAAAKSGNTAGKTTRKSTKKSTKKSS